MPFEIFELSSDAEFPELVEVEWAAFEKPYCNLIRLYFPIHSEGPEARAAAIKESTERQIGWHRSDPTSHWIKVTDTETGALAGAAYWHIYESNPYTAVSDDECTWFPAGEDRQIANQLMGQFLESRMTYMTKPHVFLDICFTHPDYRRRGVGRLMMEWGVHKADELGLESYIDATAEGKPLYENYGFVAANGIDLDASKPDPSPRWKEREQYLLPFRFWPMWRPAGGKMEPGTVKPWEATAELSAEKGFSKSVVTEIHNASGDC